MPKLGAGRMVAGGLLLVGIGQALLTVAAVDSSWTVFLPGEIIALIGTGIFNPAVSQLALGSAPQEMSGLAAGVNDTFRQAGIAVGVAALGALVPAAHAFGGDAQTYVDGMKDALWVGAAVCVAGADRVRRAAGRAPQARDRPASSRSTPPSLPGGMPSRAAQPSRLGGAVFGHHARHMTVAVVTGASCGHRRGDRPPARPRARRRARARRPARGPAARAGERSSAAASAAAPST